MFRQLMMASRSLFFSLRRNRGLVSCNCKSILCFHGANVCNYCSSGAPRSHLIDESTNFEENDDLKSRIFSLRLPKRSATNVIQRWVNKGNQITISELRQMSKELRKLQRYKHALEITEWMFAHDEFKLSDADYAVRIDLMTKVFGIDAAERYFESLPIAAKTGETYTALLHSYAGAKWTEKAEDLYEKIKEFDLSFGTLLYNEMMTLYISVGQLDKVSSVVEDLKRKKVQPDIYTYNLWISSCAATLNIDEVGRILDEMSQDACSNEDWVKYITLVNIYVRSGHLLHADSSSIVESPKGITRREWITYDFLIILNTGLGNKDKIDQIWKSLRMTKQKMTSRNYICVLSSYVVLEHLNEVGEVIDQWKESTTSGLDVSAFGRLLDAFIEAGLTDKANNFLKLLIQKNCQPADVSKYEYLQG